MTIPYFKKPKRDQHLKRYIKFLSINKSEKVNKDLINSAPNSVIKVISNAALNAHKGDIRLTAAQKKLFASNPRFFSVLTARKTSLKKKKQALVQKGGFSILPTLLGVVLSTLGSALFEKLK